MKIDLARANIKKWPIETIKLLENSNIEILKNQMACQKSKHHETCITISQVENKATTYLVKESLPAIADHDSHK
jgi:hypothetical protein